MEAGSRYHWHEPVADPVTDNRKEGFESRDRYFRMKDLTRRRDLRKIISVDPAKVLLTEARADCVRVIQKMSVSALGWGSADLR